MAKDAITVKRSHNLRRVIFEMEDGNTLVVDGVFITEASISVALDCQTEFNVHGVAPFAPSRYNTGPQNDPYIETGYTAPKQLKG